MKRALHWLLADRTSAEGRWVVAQWPNPAAWVFLVLTAVGWVLPGDPRWVWVATRLALAWWAVDEVVRGVNPFRRLLGAGTLAVAVVGVVQRSVT